MIRVDPLAYLFSALLLLMLPLEWIFSAVAAAVFHELCHGAAIYLLGGRIFGLRIGAGGAAMETELWNSSREFWCAAAGPAGSFLLLALYPWLPKLAICAAVQGIFNLLPVYPLDGGRMLRILLKKCLPKRAEKIGKGIETGTVLAILVGSLAASVVYSIGILPPVMAAVWIIRGILRKRPCKQGENRVQ